jgi:hypothetical protein
MECLHKRADVGFGQAVLSLDLDELLDTVHEEHLAPSISRLVLADE